ncbi:hypothetical protein M1563_02895 [Patescibacteria group bacterium]|nr:hypothetical protein [Patescibacteria group bacterium]
MGGETENFSWGEYDFSKRDIKVLDTSLRDGEQSGVIRLPSLKEELSFVELLVQSGLVDAIDISLPAGRGSRLKNAIEIAKRVPKHISVVCLARTKASDIGAAEELLQKSGRPIEGIIFVGSSNKRRDVEKWEMKDMVRWMGDSVCRASKAGIIPIVATEHTTETSPGDILQIFRAGLDNGGKKVCIADTTGIATPMGARRIVRFFKDEVVQGYEKIEIQWHGHGDRELAVANTLAALDAGADTAQGTINKVGERAGNTDLLSLWLNLKQGEDPHRQDLTSIRNLSEYASKIFSTQISPNHPIIGENNRIVASGIHASAHRKARLAGVESPYLPFNPKDFGYNEVTVVIGPKSGEANVREVAEQLGFKATPLVVEKLLGAANDLNQILTKEQVLSIVSGINGNGENHGSH